MASCSIIEGYTLDCKLGAGGLKTIYFTEFANVPQANITSSSGAVTALSCSAGKKFYIFQLRPETADYKQSWKNDLNAGTVFYEQTVTLNIYKLNAKNRNIMSNLNQNRLMCIVETINGEYFLLGQTRGMDMTVVEDSTGKAMGEMNGSVLTLVAKEVDAANTISSAIVSTLT